MSSAPRTWRASPRSAIASCCCRAMATATHEEWRSTLASAGCAQGYFAKHETLNTRDVINYLLFDFSNPSSVKSCLAAARRNGRAQRTSLTRDMWESLNSAWIEFSNINPSSVTAGELPRILDWVRSRSAALSRRAAQHDPAQRHVLLQPARHVPRARRQHGAHSRREVLRAAAADRDGRRRRRQRAVGRHPALGVGASQLPLGLQAELPPVAHRRVSHPQSGDAALAALLLRRDQSGARRSRRTVRRQVALPRDGGRRRAACSPTATSTRYSSRGCTSSSRTSSCATTGSVPRSRRAYHFNG